MSCLSLLSPMQKNYVPTSFPRSPNLGPLVPFFLPKPSPGWDPSHLLGSFGAVHVVRPWTFVREDGANPCKQACTLYFRSHSYSAFKKCSISCFVKKELIGAFTLFKTIIVEHFVCEYLIRKNYATFFSFKNFSLHYLESIFVPTTHILSHTWTSNGQIKNPCIT
jgi:hypothetical protein